MAAATRRLKAKNLSEWRRSSNRRQDKDKNMLKRIMLSSEVGAQFA